MSLHYIQFSIDAYEIILLNFFYNFRNILQYFFETDDWIKMNEVWKVLWHFHHLSYSSNELQIMHAVELTRVIRLANPSSRVTINALHPGVCFTNLMRYNFANHFPIRQLLTPFFWFFMKTDRARFHLFYTFFRLF